MLPSYSTIYCYSHQGHWSAYTFWQFEGILLWYVSQFIKYDDMLKIFSEVEFSGTLRQLFIFVLSYHLGYLAFIVISNAVIT